MSTQAVPAPPALADEISIPGPWLSSAVEGVPIALERFDMRATSLDYLSKKAFKGLARRTLGIVLLLITVFLWTASNFLASVSV